MNTKQEYILHQNYAIQIITEGWKASDSGESKIKRGSAFNAIGEYKTLLKIGH